MKVFKKHIDNKKIINYYSGKRKTNIMKNNEKAEGDNYADNCMF